MTTEVEDCVFVSTRKSSRSIENLLGLSICETIEAEVGHRCGVFTDGGRRINELV